MITKLTGIEPFGIDGGMMARECQKKFACSASYAACISRPSIMEISIQVSMSISISISISITV
jgi:translation initiation factor 1 (eIF-1/SUI1)